MAEDYDIFLVTAPGLEAPLADEARAAGFAGVSQIAGGVACRGGRSEVVRANLVLRGAVRVLVRIAEFRAMHLAQLDKRARKVAWGDWLRPDRPVRIEAACHKSRIYHAGAAAQRVGRAVTETLGVAAAEDAALRVMVRLEDDLCTISLDTTGEPLHRRGHKEAVGKAPLRENMAAMFLAQMGYDGQETVLDPMCGSGTIPIEAAEIAAGLWPGRSRGFAFEHLAGDWPLPAVPIPATPAMRFYGSDRDQGVIASARANAARAGVSDWCSFDCKPFSAATPPDGPPGLVLVNPPYGTRIGERKLLFGLYGTLGQVLKTSFKGWRAGIVTSDGGLAKATGLRFVDPLPPVVHGGLSVSLYRTGPL